MYIVTGGLGFIGSNLVEFLNKQGVDDIIIVDDINVNNFRNISGLKYSHIISIDESLNFILNNRRIIKGVFHQGACTNTLEDDPAIVIKSNKQYTEKLITFCIGTGQTSIPLVYASSASVYGNSWGAAEGRSEYEDPLNLYAFSKLAVDKWVQKFIEQTNGFDYKLVGLRYFNVYGPREAHKGKMASFIYQKYKQYKNENRITLFSPGDQSRDFIYVNDVCKVNWVAMNSAINGIYNVGTGVATKFEDIADTILEYCGIDSLFCDWKKEFIKFPDELRNRYQYVTQANLDKLRTFYSDDFISTDVGIHETLEYYGEIR